MKKILMYGNCQAGGLFRTMRKNMDFKNSYQKIALKFVHDLNFNDIMEVKESFLKSDLIIYQHVNDGYKIPELSTSRLFLEVKKNIQKVSFPSLYFNGYFPHLDTFNGHTSILNLVHDYMIMALYLKGMNQNEILDLLENEDLYTQEVAETQLNNALKVLKKREEVTDLKISDFIEKKYKIIKLFDQFNHPKGIIFDVLANQIFEILNLPEITISTESIAGLGEVMYPIYRSTYKHLKLEFKEDFTLYGTNKGHIRQDEVVHYFIEYYNNIDKNEILDSIKAKKPFIMPMLKKLHI